MIKKKTKKKLLKRIKFNNKKINKNKKNNKNRKNNKNFKKKNRKN